MRRFSNARRGQVLTVLVAGCFTLVAAQESDHRSPTAPQTEPTFVIRVNANLVFVRVVVRDTQGRPVAGLDKNSFRVFDNNKPQTISYFSVEKATPQSSSANGPGEKEAALSKKPPASALPQRYTALFFDDLHLNFADLTRTREAAERYLSKALDIGDRVGVFTASGQGNLNFTGDREKLRTALAELHFQNRAVQRNCPDLTPNAAQLVLDGDPEARAAAAAMTVQCLCAGNPENCPAVQHAEATARYIVSYSDALAESTLAALRNLIRRMGEAPGQRTIGLVSDGFETRTHRDRLGELIDRAVRLNVTINSLDARGLYAAVPGGDASTSGPALGPALERPTGADLLAEAAEGTGGNFVRNSNDYDSGFQKIGAMPEVSYLLGFVPQDLKFDGRYHALKTSLTGDFHGGVQARRGYFAPRQQVATSAQKQEELDQLVYSQDERNDLPARIETRFAGGKGSKQRLSMSIVVDARAAHFRNEGESNLDDFLVFVALFDRDGTYVTGKGREARLRLSDAQLEQAKRAGLGLETDLDVQPGSYFVRVVLKENASDQLTELNRSIEVPTYEQLLAQQHAALNATERAAIAPEGHPQTKTGEQRKTQELYPGWSPPDVSAPLSLASTSACSLQEVLAHAGERARDLVANLGNFAARERVQYEELDSYGMLRSTQTAIYDYAASIEQRPNQLVLSETRRASRRDKQLGGVAQDGGISLGLIFHPYYQADYDLRCEGMDRWKGVAAWVIDFKQRKDRPGRTRSFNTAQGAYHLRLKGRAWIAADSYQILHIETNLADPVLFLRSDAVSVDYAPVDFRSHNLQIWLPRTTQSYSDFMERRQIVLHTFSDFLLSSVETNQTTESPH